MRISRRDFLRVATGMAGVLGFEVSGLLKVKEALAAYSGAPVIWLQGQSCTGCSISFLNSINLASVDDLLLKSLNLEYHPNIMAAAGDFALSAAHVIRPSTEEVSSFASDWLKSDSPFDLNDDEIVNLQDYSILAKRGFTLVVEGSIPTKADGHFCHIGGGMSMLDALSLFGRNAGLVIAVGTCAAYGGINRSSPNPTGALGVKDAFTHLGVSKAVVNIPGCPIHPDWLVGTIIDVLTSKPVILDDDGRPVKYFSEEIHDEGNCPLHDEDKVYSLGKFGCLKELGCKGPDTHADCFSRKWNSPGPGQSGVNWCIGAGSPCIGCTERNFPNGDFAPFYTLEGVASNDGITVWEAEFDPDDDELKVEATCVGQPAETLTVEGYGSMTWRADKGHYRYKLSPTSKPSGMITVTSGSGGSVSCGVEEDD